MVYDIIQVMNSIADQIEAVYITDAVEDKYIALKDTKVLRGVFGKEGRFTDMVNFFLRTMADKTRSAPNQYIELLPNMKFFHGRHTRKTKMILDDRTVYFQVSNYHIEGNKFAMIMNELDENEYVQEVFKSEKANLIKSAYLFSMHVDLDADICNSIDMSEIQDEPVNFVEIQYTKWRETIKNMIHEDDRNTFLKKSSPEYLRENLKYEVAKSIDCQMMNLEGKFIWVKLIFNRIETGNADDFRFVFMVEDIHESHIRLMNDLKKYEDMAQKDSLTGLLNHGRIEAELNNLLEECCASGKTVSLVMFDIDHFKHVNDQYGHDVGDYVLKTIALISRKHFAAINGKLGRWGGEEFLGICEGISEDELYEFSESLRKQIEAYNFDKINKITSSFGILQIKEGQTGSEAFKCIDNALYRAKSNGRNRVEKG